MKRSKNQAVYKFLPKAWVSEQDDSNMAVTAQITKWNYKEMKGIYEDFIEDEIHRQIELFGKEGEIFLLLTCVRMYILLWLLSQIVLKMYRISSEKCHRWYFTAVPVEKFLRRKRPVMLKVIPGGAQILTARKEL